MRTTIDIPDHIMKKAKIKAIEEGVTLKEYLIKSLEKELSASGGEEVEAPWKTLRGKGSASGLSASDSGFQGYSGPDWNHGLQVNDPSLDQ